MSSPSCPPVSRSDCLMLGIGQVWSVPVVQRVPQDQATPEQIMAAQGHYQGPPTQSWCEAAGPVSSLFDLVWDLADVL